MLTETTRVIVERSVPRSAVMDEDSLRAILNLAQAELLQRWREQGLWLRKRRGCTVWLDRCYDDKAQNRITLHLESVPC